MAGLTSLVDLVLPTRCIGCGSPSAALCAQCWPWDGPFAVPHPQLRVVAATSYGGAVRAAVLGYKEHGRRDLAAPLARLLATAVDELVRGQPAVLVGVPSARVVARARGGDHVARLARLAAKQHGIGAASPLRLVRAVADSAGLGVAARRANTAASMVAAAPTTGAAAVLVDDIVTTGSTLAEAVRALCAAGWNLRGAAVIAATPLDRRAHGGDTAVPLARPG